MKKIKIGVVGPEDSVMLIKRLAEEFQQLYALPFSYANATESIEIVNDHYGEVDIWLFSGAFPYYIVKEACPQIDMPMIYIPHTGSSLFRTLLQIIYIENIENTCISFDMYKLKELKEIFDDTKLVMPNIYVKEFDPKLTSDDIVKFHLDLWNRGKIDFAVTCYYASYRQLISKGVKAFRIWPTTDNIRNSLKLVIRTAEAQHYKEGQIAVQHIAIDNYDDFVRQKQSIYNVYILESQLYQILVKYSAEIKGSIVNKGNGTFVIYSTRGVLEQITSNMNIIPVAEEISGKLSMKVSAGIGFGITAHDAEKSAIIALGYARKSGPGNWMVLTDDKEVIGPLNSEIKLRYGIRSNDSDLSQIAKKLRVSVTTLNRLIAAFQNLEDSFDAEQLAFQLSISMRSAHRLLSTLQENGIVTVVGNESSFTGRPKKIYSLVSENIKEFFSK